LSIYIPTTQRESCRLQI